MKEQKTVAKQISTHVAMYWSKIDKIVVYKHKGLLPSMRLTPRQLYERRSELMDRHLQFMLKQTEDYTSRLSKRIIASDSDGDFIHPSLTSSGEWRPGALPAQPRLHAAPVPAEGPGVAGVSVRAGPQRHSGGRDGPGQNAADHLAAGVPGGHQGHLGPAPDRGADEHDAELGVRVQALLPVDEGADLLRLREGAAGGGCERC